MASLPSPLIPTLLFTLFFALSSAKAYDTVPTSGTFKFVNTGSYDNDLYDVEYGAQYRPLANVVNGPFVLCFYNTTPDSYTLALRMGTNWLEYGFYWVWEANRGRPVRENATLAFGRDGNLVLTDADGRMVWQTDTANKGVVGLKLLSDGNMVLHDAKGKFLWQSFDYPTDTLLVGQYLRANGPTRLVSRLSTQVNKNGPYSLALRAQRVVMSYKSEGTPKPLVYYAHSITTKGIIKNITFDVSYGDYGNGLIGNVLNLGFVSQDEAEIGSFYLADLKYNATLSFLRLGIDGNLRVFTHFPGDYRVYWDTTFTLLSRDKSGELWDSECQMVERCGEFGVCENNECVGCPTAKGLLGWSKECQPPRLRSCGGKIAKYFKVERVEHFSVKYTKGEGPMKEGDCESKCTKGCKCKGYFFNLGTSRCWIVDDLKTLSRVKDSKHVGYVKISS